MEPMTALQRYLAECRKRQGEAAEFSPRGMKDAQDCARLLEIIEVLAKAHKENAGFFNPLNYQASECSTRSEEALRRADEIAQAKL